MTSKSYFAFTFSDEELKKKKAKKQEEKKVAISAADFFGGGSVEQKERKGAVKRKAVSYLSIICFLGCAAIYIPLYM